MNKLVRASRWMTLSSVLTFGLFFAANGVAADAPKDPKKDAPADAPKAKDPKDMTLDECEANDPPICPVTRKPSKPIYHYTLGGKDYHFNTREAQKQFAENPAKYGYKK